MTTKCEEKTECAARLYDFVRSAISVYNPETSPDIAKVLKLLNSYDKHVTNLMDIFENYHKNSINHDISYLSSLYNDSKAMYTKYKFDISKMDLSFNFITEATDYLDSLQYMAYTKYEYELFKVGVKEY